MKSLRRQEFEESRQRHGRKIVRRKPSLAWLQVAEGKEEVLSFLAGFEENSVREVEVREDGETNSPLSPEKAPAEALP